jgi:hypothetical protein
MEQRISSDRPSAGGHHGHHGHHGAGRQGRDLAAELDTWNRAFSELELPWHWDVGTYRELLRIAGEGDCVAAYIEREQPHLLRVYEKSFLGDLVREARERCRAETAG